MQRATGLQFYYVTTDPKVDEYHILLITESTEKSESTYYSLS